MKSISLKGLADFVDATVTKQRAIVRQYKYPKDDEARAKIVYYREARDVVEAYHRTKKPPAWLEEEAMRLDVIGGGVVGRARTRLRHNSRGIRQYAKHFSSKAFEPLNELKMFLSFGDVRVSVVPDLHVREGTEERVIKLEFGVDSPSGSEIKVISQMLFEATKQAAMSVPSAGVLYLDVPRGIVHKGARAGARTVRSVEDACKTISAIWDQI